MRTGRPERPIEANVGPAAPLAAELRQLRDAAGAPTYRQLAQQTHYSVATVSRALSGRQMPSLEVTVAIARACGGDPDEWRARWHERQDEAQHGDAGPGDAAGQSPARLVTRFWPPARPRLAVVATLVVVAAGVGGVAMVTGHWNATSSAPRQPATASAVPQESGLTDRLHRDGDDPQVTGCSQDARTLDTRPVYLPDHTVFGQVLLRYSASCAMAWGSVIGPDPHLYRVYIIARRPVDGTRAPSSWALNTPPGSYGNMLSTGPGCVRIDSYVVTPSGSGPVSSTRCTRGT